MKAMILAAGEGTRLRPLTYELPKPMIPLLGKPLMEYLVEQLAAHQFRDIMVNVSHLPHLIENYFGNGARWGVNIGYSFEGRIEKGRVISEPLGSAGGIKRIHEFGGFFDDTFLVVCGDAIFDLDLSAALRKHWQSGAQVSVVAHRVPRERVSDYGVLGCDRHGRVTSFQEKPPAAQAKSTLVHTGICLFEPDIVAHIPSGENYDIGAQLLPSLIDNGVDFRAIEMPFHWVDIGRVSDYWHASQQLMRGTFRGVAMPGREVLPRVWAGLNVRVDWDDVLIEGPVYIGANSRIDAGCEIHGPTWISHGCHLQRRVKVHRSILFENTLLRENGAIFETVVFGRHCVDKEGKAVDGRDAGLDWVGEESAATGPGPAAT